LTPCTETCVERGDCQVRRARRRPPKPPKPQLAGQQIAARVQGRQPLAESLAGRARAAARSHRLCCHQLRRAQSATEERTQRVRPLRSGCAACLKPSTGASSGVRRSAAAGSRESMQAAGRTERARRPAFSDLIRHLPVLHLSAACMSVRLQTSERLQLTVHVRTAPGTQRHVAHVQDAQRLSRVESGARVAARWGRAYLEYCPCDVAYRRTAPLSSRFKRLALPAQVLHTSQSCAVRQPHALQKRPALELCVHRQGR